MIGDAIVVPLTRKTGSGDVLQRPARIQAEIAAALKLSAGEVLARAAGQPPRGSLGSASPETMSEECMVHLIRRDLRARTSGTAMLGGRLAEDLTPILLERCERGLRRSIRGFPASACNEIREEVLGRLAVSLAGTGDEADFLEVRFALALKRLRIDICRRERRRLHGLVALEEPLVESADSDSETIVDRMPPLPASQEDRLLIQQALSKLTPEERKVLVLHKLAGVPMNSTIADGTTTLVSLLGRSERTLRNRLRSAEAKLAEVRQEDSEEDRN